MARGRLRRDGGGGLRRDKRWLEVYLGETGVMVGRIEKREGGGLRSTW